MRRPWILIAVALVALGGALPLTGCSRSDDDPTAYDCAQWDALSRTALAAALEKLALDNFSGGFSPDRPHPVFSDDPTWTAKDPTKEQIKTRIWLNIMTLCGQSGSPVLVPAARAVAIEREGGGSRGGPVRFMYCGRNLGRPENLKGWAQYKFDQAPLEPRTADITSGKLLGCREGRECGPGEVAETIDERARTYWCKMRQPQEELGRYVPDREPEKKTGNTWAGTWSSNFGTIELRQSGATVTGRYTHDRGKITGSLTGNGLEGKWSESPTYKGPKDAGPFLWELSPGGRSFRGNWSYDGDSRGGSWSGSCTAGPCLENT